MPERGRAFAIPAQRRIPARTPALRGDLAILPRQSRCRSASQFSKHNIWRGGATFAHRMSVCPLLIKLMGDWSSDAYIEYINHTTPADLARLPRALAKAIAAMA
jgi:hypothetical protein